MNILYTKKVLDKGEVTLLEVMGNDKAIVDAARISYSSNKIKTVQDDESLINYLYRNQHTSVFEMCEVKFYLKMPIFVHNQLVRHRMASQNVASARYSEMPDQFYIPAEQDVTFQSSNNKQGGSSEQITPLNIKNPDDFWDGIPMEHLLETWKWEDQFKMEQEICREKYERYLKSGMRKELARINLPISQYTELYWKIDLKNLFHFLKLRLDSHAQYEIRAYAEAIYEAIKPHFPLACVAFENYELESIKLSKKDIEAIGILLGGTFLNNQLKKNSTHVAENIFNNKREREEFIVKLGRLLNKN